MTPTDLRVLCAALGFTAVAMQRGQSPKKESALRAVALAGLIEEFCRATLPDVFGEPGENGQPDDRRLDTQFAVAGIYRETGGCLPHDLIARGFTHDEIDRHWPMAKALALVELKIMDS